MILGAPAKAVRESDDKVRAMIARAADVYVKRWKQYAEGAEAHRMSDAGKWQFFIDRGRHVHRHRRAGA